MRKPKNIIKLYVVDMQLGQGNAATMNLREGEGNFDYLYLDDIIHVSYYSYLLLLKIKFVAWRPKCRLSPGNLSGGYHQVSCGHQFHRARWKHKKNNYIRYTESYYYCAKLLKCQPLKCSYNTIIRTRWLVRIFLLCQQNLFSVLGHYIFPQ